MFLPPGPLPPVWDHVCPGVTVVDRLVRTAGVGGRMVDEQMKIFACVRATFAEGVLGSA